MVRWQLLLTTLPLVIGVLVLTFIRDAVLRIAPLLDFGDLAPVLTGAALIIGFMLSGVIGDYRDAEKLPGQLVAGLWAVEDAAATTVAAGNTLALPGIREQLYNVSSTIEDWLLKRASYAQALDAVDSLNAIAGAIDLAGGRAYSSDMMPSIRNVRGAVASIQRIRQTAFIQTGYVLLDLLVAATLILLIVAGFKNTLSQYLIITFVSLIYIYLVRLIRDLDNPFDYAPSGQATGAAEVDLASLRGYREKLGAALERDGRAVAAPAPAAGAPGPLRSVPTGGI